MIRLLYFDIRDMRDYAVKEYLEILPSLMIAEIDRFNKMDDRKSRLVARLMLLRCLQEYGKDCVISDWSKNTFGKPYIPGWRSFNITHAGHMVILAHSLTEVGIDIEKHVDLDYYGIAKSFHVEEQLMLWSADDKEGFFFEIWTKKEALIKAQGTGISDGLDHFSCVLNKVRHNSVTWYFKKIFIHKQYTCHVCSSNEDAEIKVDRFRL